jgi:uncharacterized membrane protein
MLDPTHLHPMIIHFPIALLIVGFLAELIGVITTREFYSRAGFYLLLLGTAGVVAGYISGDLAGEGLAEGGALKAALEAHEGAAQLALWIAVATSLVRIGLVATRRYAGALRWIPLVMFFVSVLAIARTGYFGGQLVFKHAAGVQLSLEDTLGANPEAPAPANEQKDPE